MDGKWYISRNGLRHGPYSLAAMRQLSSSGQLGPGDMVWTEGTDAWRPAREVFGASAAAYSTAPPGLAAATTYATPMAPPAVLQTTGSHEGMARTSMILGIVGLLLFGVILGPLAIIFAAIAMSGMSRTGDQRGRGMAIAGLVLGILDTIGGLLFISAYFGD